MYSEKLELFRDLYGGKFPEFIFKEIYKNAQENLLTFSSVLREKYYSLNRKLLNLNFRAQ